MALVHTLDEIEADLRPRLTADILGAAGQLEVVFGARELKRNSSPPRITWVRRPGSFAGSSHQRPQKPARSLRTWNQTIEAHVWTAADDKLRDSLCEKLTNLLVSSVYRVAHGSFEAVGDDWPQPTDTKLGFVCVVTFRIAVPVTDDAAVFVRPTNFNLSASIDSGDADDIP